MYHNTQKIALIVDSSMEAEAHATGKGGELVCYARTVLRALGVPQLTPTLLGTNNLANRRIGLGIVIGGWGFGIVPRTTSIMLSCCDTSTT